MLYNCAKIRHIFHFFRRPFTITSPHKPVGGLVVKFDSSLVLLTFITGNLFNLRRNQELVLACILWKHEMTYGVEFLKRLADDFNGFADILLANHEWRSESDTTSLISRFVRHEKRNKTYMLT